MSNDPGSTGVAPAQHSDGQDARVPRAVIIRDRATTWLRFYYDDVRALMTASGAAETPPLVEATVPPADEREQEAQEPGADEAIDEAPVQGQSRYAPLAEWLYQLPATRQRVSMAFAEIEELIGGELPPSAHEYRSWWANDSRNHPHARLWLDAGWRVDEVDQTRAQVVFARLQDRERDYVAFFDALFADLHTKATFAVLAPTRTGHYWQSVARLPHQPPAAGYITFSFTRTRRPRADLYIDRRDRSYNKALFDQLSAQREQIEQEFRGRLTWERIDDKRASRVAAYYDREIGVDAPPAELAQLRAWGVDVLIRLH